MSISSFAHELGNVLEISVYLKSGSDANAVKNRIKEFEYVEGVKIIPKDVSWTNFKREMNLPDISNPLPDTLHVKVDKPENITEVFNKVKELNSVEDISYAQDLAKRIQMINHVVNTITVFVVIIMAILTITSINNTKNAIMISENLIKTKGFEECLIYVNDNSINIVVNKNELTKEDTAQIQNIIAREMNAKLENIHITTK